MTTDPWYQEAIFYHIYPLGLCGAPQHNYYDAPVEQRLNLLYPWLGHAQDMGANALYLGPVFQSSTHGYDTSDYFRVDRRLGDNQAFAEFADHVHQHGMKLVLDGVFNHVGRDFWAFRDVLEKGEKSAYVDWFYNLRFGETSAKGDPFIYENWHGHDDLVKLNLDNPAVRSHLFEAVSLWMDEFGIDGLRLDAADCIDLDFHRALHAFTKQKRGDFWLMGEVVHGDYRDWANPQTLDSVTNYACYKGLYSSLNDSNYFEIAHSLNRQFGDPGLYKDLHLYNFVDNHDVDRAASILTHAVHLYPLYMLLFTMPGIPSVYYGSEWGLQGKKGAYSDAPLRPALELSQMLGQAALPDLAVLIRRLAGIRQQSSALRWGDFEILCVEHQRFVFKRQTPDETLVVALNSTLHQDTFELALPGESQVLCDLLSPDEEFELTGDNITITIPPSWGRILKHLG